MNAPTAAPRLRIRRARVRDLAHLAALEAAAFEHPWSETQLAAPLADASSAGWLVEEAPEDARSATPPLAYALFLRLPGEAELLRVATHPGQRGRGLATRLLSRALGILERSGRPRTHLEVAADNAPARALYARLGFSVSDVRKRYYADGADAVTMSRGPVGNG